MGGNGKPRHVTLGFVLSTDHWVDNDKRPCDMYSLWFLPKVNLSGIIMSNLTNVGVKAGAAAFLL